MTDLNNKIPKNFIMSMAPVSNSLMYDEIGMGGFKYSDILKSKIGSRVTYFNGQFYNYDVFDVNSLEFYYNLCTKIIPREKLVLGIEFVNEDFFDNLYNIVLNGKISGVYFWEYVNMPDNFIENINYIFDNQNINFKISNCNIC